MLARDHTNRGRLLASNIVTTTPWRPGMPDQAVPDYPEAHRVRLVLLFERKRFDDVIRLRCANCPWQGDAPALRASRPGPFRTE